MEKNNKRKINKLSSSNSSNASNAESNHENKFSYDSKFDQPSRSPKYFSKIKESSEFSAKIKSNIVFRRSMSSREVRIELFMLEGIEDFECKPLRPRMQIVINKGCKELKDLFFQKGIDEDLPKSWEEFKEFIVEFCCDQGIESISKYRDEPWSMYFTRLKEWAMSRNYHEEKVFKRIRTQWLPRDLKMIFLPNELKLENAIERVKEWESFKPEKHYKDSNNKKLTKNNAEQTNKKKFNNVKKDVSEIKCFKCKKYGHYSTTCTDAGKINVTTIKTKDSKDIDIDKVFLNDTPIEVVFDTGATDSIIALKSLKKLKNVKC
jgi:hypothetical protein